MDPYNDPDRHSETTIEAMVTRLEERGRHPVFARMIEAYLREVPTDRPHRVLDLGCGTGVVARALENRLHPASVVVGADISRRLLDAARALSPQSRILWQQVSPGPLPFGDLDFDLITMHTLLSHVAAPGELLRETRRLLKRGGTLIVFDADHASTTYGLPEYARMRAIDQKLVEAIATHPDICRQLPRLLKAAGLTLERHESEIFSECGRGDFWLSSVRGFARLIPALGILPEEDGRAWVEAMLASHEEGTFFAAGSYYTFFAIKEPC
jgi:ubiquinone/menaquinone biosynthesis C-methylase UbiE